MSSEYKVPLTSINRIEPHSGADRLELAYVYDFQVVVPKGRYKVGDYVIYVPIDSVLPSDLEAKLFPPDAKVKLHKSRVKQIRLRGLASQGMLVDTEDLKNVFHHGVDESLLELDFSETLGVTKYEPPVPGFANTIGKDKQRNRKIDNPHLHKMNGISNIKWFPSLFAEGEEVVVQEKLHGSNVRLGVLPFVPRTLWQKIKAKLGFLPEYEKCYGSNNVQISSQSSYRGWYGEDVYGAVLKKVNAFNKVRPNETIFGELIGKGIQKNYDYGHKDEHHFVLFDVKILQPDGSQRWLNPEEVEAYAKERGFDFVPVLYRGPFNKEAVYKLTEGDSVYCPKQKVREGVVVKSRYEYNNDGNKKCLKVISEKYLDKDQSDFH